jgi:two-component system, NarL family, response regulator LiaR
VSDTRPIRILVADDHAIVREGLRALIEDRPDMELVGAAADGVEALALTLELQPDLLLLDLMMPRIDGIAVIQELRGHGLPTRILVLTSYTDDDKVFAAIKAGALGYLLKDSSPQDLLRAIRTVAQGESSLTPSIALKVIQELNRPSPLPPTTDPLTERELIVLKYVAQGLSNQEIAGRLTISERTAGSHVSNILDKLHLANRTQAALYALRSGIADLNETT